MAQVHINEAEWSSLSESDRKQIADIMTSTRLISSPSDLVPQSAADSFASVSQIAAVAPSGSVPQELCKIAVGAAETAAVGACQSLGNPIGVTACVAVAHLAAKAARAGCEKLP